MGADGQGTPETSVGWVAALGAWLESWELLIVSLCFLATFAIRQTGSLPGRTIRVTDVLLVAVALFLVMRADGVRGRLRDVHIGLAGASIALAVVGVATSSVAVQGIASSLSAYLVAAAFVFVVSFVLRQQRVTADTLFGAVAAYLAVAVMFASVYTVIARSNPEAFDPPQPVIDGQTDLYYFSFITVTSVGYGDISPASDLVRVLAPIEAIVGLVLIAGLVGRIVGLLVAQTTGPATQASVDQVRRQVRRLEPDDVPGSPDITE